MFYDNEEGHMWPSNISPKSRGKRACLQCQIGPREGVVSVWIEAEGSTLVSSRRAEGRPSLNDIAIGVYNPHKQAVKWAINHGSWRCVLQMKQPRRALVP